MKVLGYTRVSKAEQGSEGVSIDVQRASITEECDRRRWELCEVLEDAGHSAKDLDRPALQSALTIMAEGHVDALVVAKLDRLSRSLLDFASVMETARTQGWALVALDLNVDTTTPAGEMMANVLATFAQFERRLISQRTKDALAEKKRQGIHLGRDYELPLDVRREIWRLRDSGETFASIARILTARGIPPARGEKWHRSSILYMCLDREQAEAAQARDPGDLRPLPASISLDAGEIAGQAGIPVD